MMDNESDHPGFRGWGYDVLMAAMFFTRVRYMQIWIFLYGSDISTHLGSYANIKTMFI